MQPIAGLYRIRFVALAVMAALVGGARADPLAGLKIDGEQWTYHDDQLSLQGILVKPTGPGPFPAVLISHGLGGSASSFGELKARELAKWGMVCLACDYTHAGTPGKQPDPNPDSRRTFGASDENLARASRCLDILASLPEVDPQRLCAYGHSMGGFVTIGLAAKEQRRLLAAAISGSGIAPRSGFAAPSAEVAERIKTPLIMFHGGDDRTVRPDQSAALHEILDRQKVANERHVFAGIGHPVDRQQAAEMYRLMRLWFTRHGAFSSDRDDWPMYNRDVIGSRHNPFETTLSPGNVGQLVEKWRFPSADSPDKIGVVHATVVVNGYVYFGTENNPTFYKLTPAGKVRWKYRDKTGSPDGGRAAPKRGLPGSGFLNAALVTPDAVYVGTAGGMIYALSRATGEERWSIDTRLPPFPGAHTSNCVFSSPILAEGLVVVAGGAYEHAVAADPKNTGCTGRGFVVALQPATGQVVWKYDVGPEPHEFDQPVKVRYGFVTREFHRGPSTSSVWCTPSHDAESHTIFFGTDCHNSPRQPTPDDPRLSTRHSCAVIAVDARTGAEKWVTQTNPNDVWNYSLPPYDPPTGYKDQSIGDTPKIFTIEHDGKPTKVVGCGSKNGGFYLFDAASGAILHHTPIYRGPPVWPPTNLDPRTLALPGLIGGLQTGCASDGASIFTNGIDRQSGPPTGGRVVSLSLDTTRENWRHERPKVKAVGGTEESPAFTDVGDPVASGIGVANGVVYFTTVVSNKLLALDAVTGSVLKEIDLNRPVWCGPIISRGRVYIGTGNLLFSPGDPREAYFPKSEQGAVHSFGLPGGDDEVTQMGAGTE